MKKPDKTIPKKVYTTKSGYPYDSPALLREQYILLASFTNHMETKGLAPSTVKLRQFRIKRMINKGVNLLNPETINSFLRTFKGESSYKKTYITTYKAFTEYKQIQWTPPKLIITEKEYFIPLQEEVSQLISGCGKNTATLLKLLDETGARVGEAINLKWKIER